MKFKIGDQCRLNWTDGGEDPPEASYPSFRLHGYPRVDMKPGDIFTVVGYLGTHTTGYIYTILLIPTGGDDICSVVLSMDIYLDHIRDKKN